MKPLPKPLEWLRNEEGFTLIEVLVALTILGISLAVLLGAFSQDLAVSSETSRQMRARSLVEALIAEASSKRQLRPVSTTGETTDGLAWRVDIEPFGAESLASSPIELLNIKATASWEENGRLKIVHLETLLPGVRRSST